MSKIAKEKIDEKNLIDESKSSSKKKSPTRKVEQVIKNVEVSDGAKKSAKKATVGKKSSAKSTSKKSSVEKNSTKKSTLKESTAEKNSTKKSTPKESTAEKKSAAKSASKESITEKKSAAKSTSKESTIKKKSAAKSTSKESATEKKSAAKSTSKESTAEKKFAAKSASKESTTEKKSAAKSPAKKTSAKKPTSSKSTKITGEKKDTSKKSTRKKSEKSPEPQVQILEYYDLPYKYGNTVVKLLAQTPKTLFVYWEVSDSDIENFKKTYGDDFFSKTKPILIVHNLTLNKTNEIEINDFANCWYLNTDDSDCKFDIELGRKYIEKSTNSNDNFNKSNYLSIATSNDLQSPNNHILFEKIKEFVIFRNVNTNTVFKKNIKSFKFLKDIYRFYKEMYDEDIVNNPSSKF